MFSYIQFIINILLMISSRIVYVVAVLVDIESL